MGWIKKANKLGVYETTYEGFRIYRTRPSQWVETTEQRADGLYRVQTLIRGQWLAINRKGQRLAADNIERLGWEIDIFNLDL